MEFNIFVAQKEHAAYVDIILDTIAEAAKVRGTGIARRSPDYILKKIEEGKAILALYNGEFAGFCYIETWGHEKFVANSGLIVVDEYRGKGLAKAIKSKAFDLSRSRYPQAKLFGLTTGLAVMKINSDLGYRPVTFSELTDDEMFWKGCQTCVNYDILLRTERKHCLCTGMLFDPEKMKSAYDEKQKSKSIKSRWQSVRESVMHLKKNKNNNKDNVLSKFKRAMALL
ncbi:GNAT family N-acetyltransferase [Carboxylicivirga linearis]|uniref:GNAT family N-acetyltransferase n=1 Tax=Carboxylicivirga linearis TaxID=1628157 RepID=A0ABS5JQ01_9BACT|nr:GNAT family N-acetyltransferase [Carboxylicivirga linearis]MBS2096952.1 GNAT family N-acetyltransferase [Carboxylicivirga linearis]